MRFADPLTELRRARPEVDATWSSSPDGQAVLADVLARPGEPPGAVERRLIRRWTIGLSASLGIVIVAIAALVVLRSDPEPAAGPPAMTQPPAMQGTYAFDVTNLDLVMDNTSDVFVARVLDVEGTDEDRITTTFRVSISESVVGSARGEVLVDQQGYLPEGSVVTSIGDQTRLEVGKTYLVAVNVGPPAEAYLVMAGPIAVREITSPEQQAELVREYRAAEAR